MFTKHKIIFPAGWAGTDPTGTNVALALLLFTSASHTSCCFEFTMHTFVTVSPKPRTLQWNYGYIFEKVQIIGESLPSSTGDWDPTSSTVLENFHSL